MGFPPEKNVFQRKKQKTEKMSKTLKMEKNISTSNPTRGNVFFVISHFNRQKNIKIVKEIFKKLILEYKRFINIQNR